MNEKAFPNEFESAGMDLRDYFAAKAMQSFLSKQGSEFVHDRTIAKDSYNTADAMMEARKQ